MPSLFQEAIFEQLDKESKQSDQRNAVINPIIKILYDAKELYAQHPNKRTRLDFLKENFADCLKNLSQESKFRLAEKCNNVLSFDMADKYKNAPQNLISEFLKNTSKMPANNLLLPIFVNNILELDPNKALSSRSGSVRESVSRAISGRFHKRHSSHVEGLDGKLSKTKELSFEEMIEKERAKEEQNIGSISPGKTVSKKQVESFKKAPPNPVSRVNDLSSDGSCVGLQ